MDSIGDVLKGRLTPKEPAESRYLKSYVESRYRITPQVIINERFITLVVPHAALAGTLRLELPTIIAECKLTKRLHIRIS